MDSVPYGAFHTGLAMPVVRRPPQISARSTRLRDRIGVYVRCVGPRLRIGQRHDHKRLSILSFAKVAVPLTAGSITGVKV